MKKLVSVLFVIFALTASLSAKTNMLNVGYSVSPYLASDEVINRDLALNWIHLGSDSIGFYSQISPYYSMSYKFKEYDIVVKYSDIDLMSVGLEAILGYGGDFNFGSFGVIVGGGGYADFNYYTDEIDSLSFLYLGIGGGAHVYFQPGVGNLIINAGLSAAWKPYWFAFDESGSDSDIGAGLFDVTFSVGIGFRTGGSSSGFSSSGNDDW